MPSYEELVATEAAIFKILADGAEARLRAIPGVRHVSVGLKERGGKATRQHCIRVYVREKLPLASIPERDRIPAEISGVPTDVLLVPTYRLRDETDRVRPVKGGIAITNKIKISKVDEQGHTQPSIAVGTFGCMATRRANHKLVLLSCAHVLMAHKGRIGDYIFQPAPEMVLGPPPPAPVYPEEDDDMIATIVDYKFDTKVDAAIAEVNVSSCCRCCCKVDVRDEVLGISDKGKPPSDKLLGMRAPVSGQSVFKVGVRTGRTSGFMTDRHAPVDHFPGSEGFPTLDLVDQIIIANDDGQQPFAWEGDSGSALVDEEGWVVGLVFGSDQIITPSHRSYANNILNVCDALQIDINGTQSTHSAGDRVAVPGSFSTPEEEEQYAAARERVLTHPMGQRLMAHPAGAWLFALGEQHREEVVSLVTTHRPTSVAWHRAGGPALFAATLKTFRDGGDTLPAPADGSSLEDALARVGNALVAHGSPALREVIEAHRAMLLAAVRDSSTVDDVLQKLAPSVLVET
jgi:hypothetical protein